MRKLTQKQVQELEVVKTQLIELNAPILFDIEGASSKGIEFRKQLDELNQLNAERKETQRSNCQRDYERLQTFLGEHKDLVELIDCKENDEYFGFKIGSFIANKQIWVQYFFAREWYDDDFDRYVSINNKNHQKYIVEGIEVYSDVFGETEFFDTFDDMFASDLVIRLVEELLTEYIIVK